MAKPLTRIWLYRAVALLAFLIAQLVVLAVPQKMQEPDDWAFKYAAANFAQGDLTLDDNAYIQQSQQVWDQGGQLLGYGKVGDRWALTRAPGYVFYLAPFHLAGVPELGNALLSLGLAAVLYLLLARLKDEKTALIGVVLLLFTPIYMAMWQRVYTDSFAALATAGMGGGLYIYYWVRRGELKPRAGVMILALSGLLLAGSVAVRYTNVTIAAVFGLHFLVMAVRSYLQRERRLLLRETLAFALGAALPLGALLVYHQSVFGAPFSYGYQYAQLPVNFAWEYLGQRMAVDILKGNVIGLWTPLLLGFPLLLLAVPAIIAIGYAKARRAFQHSLADAWPEVSAHIWWLLLGWVLAVFGLYAMYEWTAFQETARIPFTLVARFYLPALLPLVVAAALLLRRLSGKIMASAVVTASVIGVLFFIQVALIQVQFAAGVTPPSLSRPAPASQPVEYGLALPAEEPPA